MGALTIARNAAGRVFAASDRSADHLRQPVRAGDAERAAVPPARDREPAQVHVPRQHVARAAHAAQRDHRLQRDAAGRRGGRRGREPGARLEAGERRRQAPPGADQLDPGPVQDRGRQDGAATGGLQRGGHGRRHPCGHPASGREERQPARTGLRCGCRDDARRPHQSPPSAVQPAEQCVQVHRAGHGVSGSAPGRVGRRRLAELQRERHRNRPERRPARPPVSRVLAGPCRRHAQVRRDGPGTGAEPAALPADGRRHRGDERTGQGQHLHRAFAGRRRADPRDDRSRGRQRGHGAGHRR